MKIKQYDKVILNTGETAYIVEILEEDKLFIADIDRNDDCDNECITIEEISKIL